MDSLKDALLKAGVIDQKKIDEQNNLQKIKEQSERQQVELQRQHNEENLRNERQNHERKLQPFNDLYINKKRFIAHLVYAFSPARIARRYWAHNSKNCVVCNRQILTMNEAMDSEKIRSFGEIYLNIMRKQITQSLLGLTSDCEADIAQLHQIFQDRKLGVCSHDSDKILCQPCWEVFQEWIVLKILWGDSYIVNIIHHKRKIYNETY